jgi:hypothetical protein
MKKRMLSAALVAGLAGLLLVGTSSTALAHEERDVGKYVVAVGFGDEPAYAGVQNSVQMFLHDKQTDKPIVDLGPTLKVEVRYGNRAMPPLTMEPNFEVGEFGTPGDYRAFFFPTRPGDYSFHFTGTIKGQKVDETFTSGKSTFSSVVDPTNVEFPEKDPTTGQLGQAVNRVIPRVESLINKGARAEAAIASLKDDVDSAKTLATLALAVGVVVGLAGLVVGVMALRAARRARATAAP